MANYDLETRIQYALSQSRVFDRGFRYRKVELPISTLNILPEFQSWGLPKHNRFIMEANLYLLWQRDWEEKAHRRIFGLFCREKVIRHAGFYKTAIELTTIPAGNIQSRYVAEAAIPYLGLTGLRSWRTITSLVDSTLFTKAEEMKFPVCPPKINDWFCKMIEAGTGVT